MDEDPARDPYKMPSAREDFERLLRGEITSQQFVKELERVVRERRRLVDRQRRGNRRAARA
jgi:hypothetical protein